MKVQIGILSLVAIAAASLGVSPASAILSIFSVSSAVTSAVTISIAISETTIIAITTIVTIEILSVSNWAFLRRARFTNFYNSNNAIFFNYFTRCDSIRA